MSRREIKIDIGKAKPETAVVYTRPKEKTLIVVTGCDRTGKSTLAKKLCKSFGVPYMHFSKPPQKAYEYFKVALRAMSDDGILVVDRWAEGDRIYAAACGHKRRLSVEAYSKLLRDAKKVNVLFVFCFDEDLRIEKRFKECGEEFLSPKLIRKVQDLFEEEAKLLMEKGINVIVCNNFEGTYYYETYVNPSDKARRIFSRVVSEITGGRPGRRGTFSQRHANS